MHYAMAVNAETEKHITELESQENDLHREVITEEVDVDFAWIPDLAFTQACENLYA